MRRVSGVVLVVLLTADVFVAASLVFLVVSSLVGSDSDDPHGYALVFGVVALLIVVPIGLALLTGLRRLIKPNTSF